MVLYLKIVVSQINFYYTDTLQHNCLRLVYTESDTSNHRILWYCIDELSSELNINASDQYDRFTFTELSKQNITSQNLYQWSASIDVAERYQFYLDQLSISNNDTVFANEYFYNCTWPKFGPICQYEFDNLLFSYSLFDYLLHSVYTQQFYVPNELTCYQHIKCDRGPLPACLDWSEVCNGKNDCLNGGHDEEYCWELETNECEENEYRCKNGQCIMQLDSADQFGYGCLDVWYDIPSKLRNERSCSTNGIPSINCEDIRCFEKAFTSSCLDGRTQLLENILFSDQVLSVNSNCSSAFTHVFKNGHISCDRHDDPCQLNNSIQIIAASCPSMMSYPDIPLSANLIFVYSNPSSSNLLVNFAKIPFICYKQNYYNDYFSHLPKKAFQNMTCIDSLDIFKVSDKISSDRLHNNIDIVSYLLRIFRKYDLNMNYTSTVCNRSNLYLCANSSKCISMHRLLDTTYDCPYLDDENIDLLSHRNLSEQLNKNYFKCQISAKYIHHSKINDEICDCGVDENYLCEDENLESNYKRNDMLFQSICDRITDILTVHVDGQNLTDETECEHWECNNIYTRCNGFRNCLNGIDELGCPSWFWISNCSSNHFLCVSIENNRLTCLPLEQINDGKVDCLGALDEVELCEITSQKTTQHKFYCKNQSSYICVDDTNLCDGQVQCENEDDEKFCSYLHDPNLNQGVCKSFTASADKSDVEHFLCDHHEAKYRVQPQFTLDKIIDLLHIPTANEKQIQILDTDTQMPTTTTTCNRGVELFISSNHSDKICLCPPMYYGSRCQYQNQRVSLTMKFRALSDSWQTVFAIVVSLIDDSYQRIVHSYEQFSYSLVENCQTKYHFYLVYATRPKDPLKNYSIHVDIYEKDSLKYRGSSLFPIHFGFLPVHRLTFFVDIPRTDDKTQTCSDRNCVHGKCITYTNYPHNRTFCQCDENWSGKYCTISHNCTCSSNSKCIDITENNRSICVCRLNQFGSRCLLNTSSCLPNDNSTCYHGGQCVPLNDDRYFSHNYCVCPKGFNGYRCENRDGKLILSFNDKNVAVSQSVLIHFIDIPEDSQLMLKSHQRATTVGAIITKYKPLIIFWSQPFLMIFTEFIGKNYYLAYMQKSTNRSTDLNITIRASNRCPPISELFNKTFLQWDLLRRIKYYHQPCQNLLLNLSCFHDEAQFCLCYSFHGKRLANCFSFDHNLKYDCYGSNECENDGSCFQDSRECPKRSICQCKPCSFGRRCQFVTDSFGLSLDAILAYHISSDLTISQQSAITLFSLAFTIIFIITGLIDGSLSLITFKNRQVLDVGCGIYLLYSSINNILTIIIFGLKYFILLLAQMTIVSDRSFLNSQCYLLDFLLRICLYMNQWINACVAVERTMTIVKDIYFDKKKSKQAARWIIIVLLIIIIGTNSHDPIHRRLIDEKNDDNDEKARIWCVVTYPSTSLQRYNFIVHIFHFFVPFIINIISSLILITTKSRQQTRIQRNDSYKQILRKQIKQYKHLLIAPIILVILALPRLILVFISKCMGSVDDAWIFLSFYFISFIPSMLNFIVFILPSEFYKNEFRRSIIKYRKLFQCCWYRQS